LQKVSNFFFLFAFLFPPFSRKPNRKTFRETNLGVAGANDLGVGKLIGEANHEAAKGLVAVEAPVVGAHALQGFQGSVGGHERTSEVLVEGEKPLVKSSG
jgi:hypothetical protein